MFCENLYRVKAEGKIPVIVDFKRISPKEGELFGTREPAEVAKILEKAGAPAFSVVTQAEEFGGSLALLKEITKAVNLPVLWELLEFPPDLPIAPSHPVFRFPAAAVSNNPENPVLQSALRECQSA